MVIHFSVCFGGRLPDFHADRLNMATPVANLAGENLVLCRFSFERLLLLSDTTDRRRVAAVILLVLAAMLS